jgi:pyruvate ferredoxin oxidoreductase gamma subunit
MFLKISDEEIRTQEPVIDPDVVVVMDETLMGSQDVAKNLDRNESLIVNSKKSSEEIRKNVPHFQGKIHVIDATGIALEVAGNPNPNLVLVGQLIKISEIVTLESAAEIFREVFVPKIGKELTEKTIQAMHVGYDTL